MPDPTAAQAVLDAYGNEVGGSAAITSYERRGIAAALRAAVDEVVPESEQTPWGSIVQAAEPLLELRRRFLAIATELEDAND